jgi:pyruvate,water dikinase
MGQFRKDPRMPPVEAPNPVHMATSPGTRWTTVNFAEAVQGVQTPLGWHIWNIGIEVSIRRSFGAIGVLSWREVPMPTSSERRFCGIFFGRAAGNVSMFHDVGDRLPGMSGDLLEEKLFGNEPAPGRARRKPLIARRRYPIVAVSMPVAVRHAWRELPRLRGQYRERWQRSVLDAPPWTLAEAQALYSVACDEFIRVGEPHSTVSMVASGLLDALGDLAERACGERALASDLATGYGAMEEVELIDDLWSTSQGRMRLDDFIRLHGYHGPDEGDLRSRTWREDRRPLEAIVRAYQRTDIASPRERERRQMARRRAAEARVLAGLSAARRPAARSIMRLAGAFIIRRELGKASFLHTMDASRCAARIGGERLAETGVLEHPDDVFFLTGPEFIAGPDASIQAVVAERRARHARYLAQALPPAWSGDPVPVALAPAPEPVESSASRPAVSELRGIGVAGEQVTGRARVVSDPTAAEFGPGDILVCMTTDPSWTPLFMLADALVIDTGGQMSHGAIVARELGVCCVINTVTGTRDIPDGATITVDGATGVVTIRARPQT